MDLEVAGSIPANGTNSPYDWKNALLEPGNSFGLVGPVRDRLAGWWRLGSNGHASLAGAGRYEYQPGWSAWCPQDGQGTRQQLKFTHRASRQSEAILGPVRWP